MVAGVTHMERRPGLTTDVVEWVASSSRLLPQETKRLTADEAVGKVCGLAVNGQHHGMLLDLEAIATPCRLKGTGKRTLTGIIDEEQIGDRQRTWRRKSMVSNSLENVLTVLRSMGYAVDDYDLHLNFSGSTPIDGPSAGVTMAVAIASAMLRMPIRSNVAMTGELGLHGAILPVGGIGAKLRAAFAAEAVAVFIPQANAAHVPPDVPSAKVYPLDSLAQLFSHIWGLQADSGKQIS
jgi:Lon-like ATP-dependent protease